MTLQFGPGERSDPDPNSTGITVTWVSHHFKPVTWSSYQISVVPDKAVGDDVFRRKRWLAAPHDVGKRKPRVVVKRGGIKVKPWGQR